VRGTGATASDEETQVELDTYDPMSPEQVESFAAGPVRVEIEHPDYLESIELSDATQAELLGDLRG
jgi:hypothetical protein